MKTTKDLFRIMTTATESSITGFKWMEDGYSECSHDQWFFEYSGHVNRLCASMYPLGWSEKEDTRVRKCEATLNEGGIQLMYWFIFDNLNKKQQEMESNLSVDTLKEQLEHIANTQDLDPQQILFDIKQIIDKLP